MKKVGIIMGSDSDLPVVEKAMDKLRAFGVPFEVHVYSAHRTPEEARAFSAGAREAGFGVLIAAAGKAAQDGLDALLSTVQMPTGIPVATVAIDGAANAALLAMEMLSISDDGLAARLAQARAEESAQVLEKSARIEAQFNTQH